jgi:hypothetical protein
MHREYVIAEGEQPDAPVQTLTCSTDVLHILSLNIFKRDLGTAKQCV